MTTSLWVISIAGAIAAGWAMLNMLGAERQRLMLELEARRAKSPPQPAGPGPERPVVAKSRPATTRANDKASGEAKAKAGKSGRGKGTADKPHAKSGARG